jgi:predicted nucleic acid-binding protein
LDSRDQIRVTLEAEAVLGVLGLLESGQVELISSDALLYETARNVQEIRRQYAIEVLSLAEIHIALNPQVEKRARYFNEKNISALDSLHLAFAEEAQADFFCTCDDALIRKAKSAGVMVPIVTPVELVKEIER